MDFIPILKASLKIPKILSFINPDNLHIHKGDVTLQAFHHFPKSRCHHFL